MAKSQLDKLIDESPNELFGMRKGAAWDSLFLVDSSHRDFGVMLAWHANCFFGDQNEESRVQEDDAESENGFEMDVQK